MPYLTIFFKFWTNIHFSINVVSKYMYISSGVIQEQQSTYKSYFDDFYSNTMHIFCTSDQTGTKVTSFFQTDR